MASLLQRLLNDNVDGDAADDQAVTDDAASAVVDQPSQRNGKNVFMFIVFFVLLLFVGYYGVRAYIFKKRAKIDLADQEGQTDYVRPNDAAVHV